ncbi:MAG: bacillithiol biosynthesis cysteine-adding enzyme BshC [Armatimonadetes bacterium]|nr:bacillithiol biosynthesis cysteine-adding enzyme BshC [Armatimonadota bacterium]
MTSSLSSCTISFRDLPKHRPLFCDFLDSFSRVSQFYSADPRNESFFPQIAQTISRQTYPREALMRILDAQNREWGAGARVMENIEKLGEPTSLAVLTGQQAGLFGGPLYTVYKAMGTVHLAHRLEKTLGRPVIPLFWVEGDDHDFAEVSSCRIIGKNNEVRTLTYVPSSSMPQVPIHRISFESSISDLFLEMEAQLMETEFKGPVLAELRSCYKEGATFVQAFARWMAKLFEPFGLVLIDPTQAPMKELAAPVYVRLLEESAGISQDLRETSSRLETLGYTPQIGKGLEATHLFKTNGQRAPIVREHDGFGTRGDLRIFSPSELAESIREGPSNFSPSVVTRPIVQDSLFPTIAYVGGPGEISYFGQLRPLYERFRLPMPVVVPRPSLTLVEDRIGKILSHYELSLSDLFCGPEPLGTRIIKAQFPEEMECQFQVLEQGLQEALTSLEESVKTLDPVLVQSLGSLRGRLLHQCGQFKEQVTRALKKKNEIQRQHVAKLCNHLAPLGQFQERTLSAVHFLAKYGRWIGSFLFEKTDREPWKHHLLLLGEK